MKKEIAELRKLMSEEGMDVYYVPSGDPHGSEYVNDHYKSCEFLSGLLAENEELIVTADKAYIWTDSRFFLQAERELAGSGIELMKMAEEGVPTVIEFLKDMIAEFGRVNESGTFTVGFDGSTMQASKGIELEKELPDLLSSAECSENGGDIRGRVRLLYSEDLADRIWHDRPEIRPSDIWEFPISSAGMSAADKIDMIRGKMEDKAADHLLVSDLTETAWLLNLRASDILYTPVFFSYILLGKDDTRLYVMDGALDKLRESCGTPNGLPESLDFVTVRPYDEIYSDIASISAGERIWMDPASISFSLWKSVPDRNMIISEASPVALAKSVKNETEIRCTRNAHIKDGAAVTRFIKWIKDAAADETQTEISAADHLEARRREMEGCFDLSFETISGYGPNGAIVHYAPSAETDLEIRPEGFLLVDSGGQYIDGTTDITRTIAVGPLTQQMKDHYTYVLKGHIAVARYVITPETLHKQLDDASREALRAAGLDFGHGVSHGVGHVLAVHEGPAGIRRKEEPCGLVPGMIITDEPGVYIAGEYGIRIENELLMTDGAAKGYPEGSVVSETITCVPYEREAINKELLTQDEIAWIDNYHAWVREQLLPYMDEEMSSFVEDQTRPL
ncbi:MAG: aminopeptidase P family protein [Mogibacterium sp.]|nr:aminopeptidase P family protein [Mogibacterium sp.]